MSETQFGRDLCATGRHAFEDGGPCLRCGEAAGAAPAAGGTRGEVTWADVMRAIDDGHRPTIKACIDQYVAGLRAALAEAEARGRRQGHEEAARIADGYADGEQRGTAYWIAHDIRALSGGGTPTQEGKR